MEFLYSECTQFLHICTRACNNQSIVVHYCINFLQAKSSLAHVLVVIRYAVIICLNNNICILNITCKGESQHSQQLKTKEPAQVPVSLMIYICWEFIDFFDHCFSCHKFKLHTCLQHQPQPLDQLYLNKYVFITGTHSLTWY